MGRRKKKRGGEEKENKIAQGDNQIFSRTKALLAYTYAYSTQVQN